MDSRYFRDLVSYGENWIEGRHGLLKNHRDPVAADVADLFIAQRDEILALELDATARLDSPGRLDQSQDGERGHRFSAT